MSPLKRGIALGAALWLAACATETGTSPLAVHDTPGEAWKPARDFALVQPGFAPEADELELSIWRKVEKMEQEAATSARRITDPGLNRYVHGVMCRVAGPYCPDFRIYIMRIPHFNASMMPNGTMQIWSGLLLRTQNEAQLANVIGHEISHYLRRHTLIRYRKALKESDGLAFLGLLAGSVTGGLGQAVLNIGWAASFASYNRDQEREADDMGLRLLVENGYDGREAAQMWDNLIKEQNAPGAKPEKASFLRSHPMSKDRAAILRLRAEEALSLSGSGDVGNEAYLAAILPHRADFLRDELALGRFPESDVVLNNLEKQGAVPGEVAYFRGEFHRLRNEEGDKRAALDAYERAVNFGDGPDDALRQLGLMRYKTGDAKGGVAMLKHYLEKVPGAEDADLLRTLIKQSEM